MIGHLRPVDGTSGAHSDVAVDGDDTGGAHRKCDSSSVLIPDCQSIQVQIIGGKLIPTHHAPAIPVEEVGCLHNTLEVTACCDQLTAKCTLGSGECSCEGSSTCKKVSVLINGKITVSDIDRALFHGQLSGLEIETKVSTVVFENSSPDNICIKYAGGNVVSHNRTVHRNSQTESLPAIVGVAEIIHIPFPQLIGLCIVTDIGNIKSFRAVLVLGDSDIASGGHIHDLSGILLRLFENGVGFGQGLNLLQNGGAGLIIHAGQTRFHYVTEGELCLLWIVQRNVQFLNREHPI